MMNGNVSGFILSLLGRLVQWSDRSRTVQPQIDGLMAAQDTAQIPDGHIGAVYCHGPGRRSTIARNCLKQVYDHQHFDTLKFLLMV